MREQNNFPADTFDEATFLLINLVQRIVATFHVNVWTDQIQKLHGVALPKYKYTVHTFQCRNDKRAIGFGVDRATGSFEMADSCVVVYADQQGIRLVAGRFQIGYVPGMQQVETTVGYGKPTPGIAPLLAPARQGFWRKNLVSTIHYPEV